MIISNGWPSAVETTHIVTSPSTEITTAQGPKFVLLGSQQNGNGNVRYRIGVAVPQDATRTFNDHRTFDELRQVATTPLANGLIFMSQGNAHLHVHGRAHTKDGTPVAFHLIKENMPDGQLAANIAAVTSADSVGHYSGFLTQRTDQPTGHIVPLTGISLNSANTFALHGFDGQEIQFDLYIDDLVVEAGLLERVGMNYKVQRDGDSARIMPLNGSPEDPYGNQPITTIPPFNPLARFTIEMAPVLLPRDVVSGHISPMPSAPSSIGGFADR